MTKAQEEELRQLRSEVDRLRRQNESLSENNRELKYELDHFRSAVSGVVWLLRQGEKKEFQL